MKQLPLGRICTACGKERKSKALTYDPSTLLAYCDNPYNCSQEHPNSAYSILKNQMETKLVSYTEANDVHKKQLLENFDAEIVEKIKTMLTKPLTLRVHDPAMAQFVVEYQEVSELPTMSDVFRYAVEQLMESNNIELLREKKAVEPVYAPEPTQPEPQPEPEEPIVFEQPKPKEDDDSDWSF